MIKHSALLPKINYSKFKLEYCMSLTRLQNKTLYT